MKSFVRGLQSACGRCWVGAVKRASCHQDLQRNLFRCPGLSGEDLDFFDCTLEHVCELDSCVPGLQCAGGRCHVGSGKQESGRQDMQCSLFRCPGLSGEAFTFDCTPQRVSKQS